MNKYIEILQDWIARDREMRNNSTQSDYDKFCEEKCEAIEHIICKNAQYSEHNMKLEQALIDTDRLMQEYLSKCLELEHRLSNCIEPKFKVGQEIWEITPLMSWKIKRIEWHKFNGGNRDVVMEIYRLGHDGNDDYNCCIMPVDSDRFFATEAEAKAKLEELKK